MTNLFFIIFFVCLGLAAYTSGAVRDFNRAANRSANQ